MESNFVDALINLSKRYRDDELAKILQTFEIPSNIVPYDSRRFPFKYISSESAVAFVHSAIRYPFGLGRFTQALYAGLKTHRCCPQKFVILESHIDMEWVNSKLEIELLKAGFEPDDFVTLNPSRYKRCFTIRWEVPLITWRIIGDKLRDYVLQETQRLSTLISATGQAIYSEVEICSYKTKLRFVDDSDIDRNIKFPFQAGAFVKTLKNITKAADIHIKIRSHRMQTDNGYRLRKQILAAGFYEIVSASGNHIYTVQCRHRADAKKAFHLLVGFAQKNKFVRGLDLEYCINFFAVQLANGKTAPIPMVVERSELSMSS